MKFAILFALASLFATPAIAQTGAAIGIAAGGTSSNQSANSHFDSSANSGFNSHGSTTGSSASGFNTTLEGRDGFAAFASTGAASSATVTTPFSVATASDHSGFAAGVASGNANFKASTQTFGQSNGDSAFGITKETRSNFTENKSSYKAANSGFAAFGGFAF